MAISYATAKGLALDPKSESARQQGRNAIIEMINRWYGTRTTQSSIDTNTYTQPVKKVTDDLGNTYYTDMQGQPLPADMQTAADRQYKTQEAHYWTNRSDQERHFDLNRQDRMYNRDHPTPQLQRQMDKEEQSARLAQAKVSEGQQEVYRVANNINSQDIANVGGFSAVGGSVLPSTVASRAKLNSLVSLTTMGNLSKMKGPKTDADIKIIADASSTLNSLINSPVPGSEAAIAKEVKRIKDHYGRVLNIYNSQQGSNGSYSTTASGNKYRVVR